MQSRVFIFRLVSTGKEDHLGKRHTPWVGKKKWIPMADQKRWSPLPFLPVVDSSVRQGLLVCDPEVHRLAHGELLLQTEDDDTDEDHHGVDGVETVFTARVHIEHLVVIPLCMYPGLGGHRPDPPRYRGASLLYCTLLLIDPGFPFGSYFLKIL